VADVTAEQTHGRHRGRWTRPAGAGRWLWARAATAGPSPAATWRARCPPLARIVGLLAW